jgi:hypothetical protein
MLANGCIMDYEENLRRTNSSTGNDKVIVRRHPSNCLYDVGLIVGYDFYAFEGYAMLEAVLCEKV